VRCLPTIKVPAAVDAGDHLFAGDGRLRLVARREFVPEVPFKLYESKKIDDLPHAPLDQLGPVLSQQVPVVTGNDFDSLLAAFNKRCNFSSDARVAPEITKSARNLADLVFPQVQPYAWTLEIYFDWVVKFDLEKRERMARALLNLHDVDFRHLNTKSLMVKGEVLLKRNDPSWAPRVIYVGSDEYNVLTGPIMHIFNKRLKSALDEFKSPHVEVMFAYGEQDTTIADFLAGQEVYGEGDYKANDKSQLRDVSLIFGYWLSRCGVPQWFQKFYLANADTFKVVSYEYGVSAELKYQLPTGATDTTARNTVWNLCMWWSFVTRYKIFGTRVAVLGDDLAYGKMGTQIPLSKWISHCADGGMQLVASHRRFLLDLTFLSRFFCVRGDQCFMVPLIGKALCRFNARANRREDLSDAEYIAGKSLSYAYEFRHIDYMRNAFLQRFHSTGVDAAVLRFSDLTWFSRQNMSSPRDLLNQLGRIDVSLSDDDFLEVIMGKYDIGLYDMDYLRDKLILDSTAAVFSDERYYNFAHEVE
jgi:hypothetical protein